MNILGLNAFHGDSSAALVQNGVLVAAAEEERFRRVKHWAGFPSQSIAYCLREAGLSLADIDHIAINQDNRANLVRKIGFLVTSTPDIGLLIHRVRNRRKRGKIGDLLVEAFPEQRFRGSFHNIEHHFCHLSSAFHVSPFDKAVVVSVDGFGDFSSAAWGVGHDKEIRIEGRVYFPHSLGIFYQALTQYLGFPHYGDEYKVMGLAPYGTPKFMDAMRMIVGGGQTGPSNSISNIFASSRTQCNINGRMAHPNSAIYFRPPWRNLLGPRRRSTNRSTTVIETSLARSGPV